MSHIMTAPQKVIASIGIVCFALIQASCTQSNTDDSIAQLAVQKIAQDRPQFQVNYVNASAAQAFLVAQPNSVVLDIRTPKEVAKGHIDGAVFADFYADDFAEQLTRLDRKTHYVVHCGSGGRSTKALTTLEALGFTNITHMDGGLRDWNKAKLPLTKPQK